MNTKTMRLPPRRVLTPSAAAPNQSKRKERDEGFERPRPNPKPSPSPNTPTALTPTKFPKPDDPRPVLDSPRRSGKGLEPTSSNQLLAGFLAHEFLTRGTLLGEPWDPSRATSEGPTSTVITEADKRKGKSSQSQNPNQKQIQTREAEPGKKERYAELAELLRGNNGTHIAGIVNPTQLSRFLHL